MSSLSTVPMSTTQFSAARRMRNEYQACSMHSNYLIGWRSASAFGTFLCTYFRYLDAKFTFYLTEQNIGGKCQVGNSCSVRIN